MLNIKVAWSLKNKKLHLPMKTPKLNTNKNTNQL